MTKRFDIGYHLSEGFRAIFTHGFMSFAAVCMIVACLLMDRFGKRVIAIEIGRVISDETGG